MIAFQSSNTPSTTIGGQPIDKAVLRKVRKEQERLAREIVNRRRRGRVS